jgi:TRAP-type C4-dicarboxylate transport system permease small subunit
VRRLVRLADRLVEDLAAGLLVALAAVTLVQVASRYLLAISLPWTEEAGRFLFTWVVWLGAAAALRRARHMRFLILVEALPPRIRAACGIVTDVLVLGFLAILVLQGRGVVDSVARTTYIAIPWLSVQYAYAVTVVVGTLMFAIQAAALVARLRRGPGPETPPR